RTDLSTLSLHDALPIYPARPEVWYVSAAPLTVGPRFWRMPVAHYPGEAHASVFRSSGGGTWERLAGGLPQPLDHMVYALVTDPRSEEHTSELQSRENLV